MIRSMTAFAAGERSTEWGALACEIRAVNHRFLELGVRLPDELRALEPQLRERVGGRVSRGKLEVSLRFRPLAAARADISLNRPLVERLSAVAVSLSNKFPGLRTEFTDLLGFPGVLEEMHIDHDGLQAEALALLDEVLGDFVQAREREGANLGRALAERLDGIEQVVAQVRGWLPEIREALQAKLHARVADLPQPLDPGRLEQEFVLWLQKLDVDEELVRLDSHVGEARRVLGLSEAVGRRMDFLLQEFNRESNTLGSKSVDSRTTRAAVELKVLIEQIREQVQNIE
jgi:uncharacterized protein (TIGR00255 family)